jgi:mannitol-1-/sugar-/sorbitol-6-phosphatase
LLRHLPRQRWAVVSSGTAALLTRRLHEAILPRPQHLVSADDVTHGKPDPEGYQRAAELLGCPASETLVIEDAPVGIAAARSAGAGVLAVATTHPVRELWQADLVVRDLTSVTVGLAGSLLVVTSDMD